MSMQISRLEIENVKRVKAVKMSPAQNGLTIIGGNNNNGKTSVLDSIAWALGGDDFRPSNPARDGSISPPYLKIVMNNGLVVERKGKNSSLKVTDPSGQKAGQQLLNTFVEKLALNLPRFMEASDSDKAKTLLNVIGVGPKLFELKKKEKQIYNERTTVGRIADKKQKFAEEQTFYPEAPDEPVSAADLIRQQQDILARNAQRQQWMREYDRIREQIAGTEDKIADAKRKLCELESQQTLPQEQLKEAEKTPEELQMESTEELEKNIHEVDEINRKVRANLDKEKAEEDARDYVRQYDSLTADLEAVRKEKQSLLEHANLPLPELSVENGKLLYKGRQWDCMSGSDQLKVATAIVRKLNPECGFVLMDKLEQMDLDTLREFGEWLEQEGLQVIATRVSNGEECSIIIEDGSYMQEDESGIATVMSVMPNGWKGGF